MPSNREQAIDFHAHTVPAAYVDLVRRGEVPNVRLERQGAEDVLLIGAAAPTGPVAQPMPVLREYLDADARLAAMNAVGVDIHVLSPVQFLYHYWLPTDVAVHLTRVVNDGIADMVRAHPRRFAGMATLPLQDPDASLRELNRVHGLGFGAVEIGTHIAGQTLDAPGLDAVWARAEALGTVVFVHPYAPLVREWLGRYYLRNLLGNPFETAMAASHLIFGGVLERFPKLRFCLAHGGGALPAVIGRLGRGWEITPECRANGATRPGHYLTRFWYDTITYDVGILETLVSKVGAERVLLGSDYPFDIADPDPVATVGALPLDRDAKRAILGENAAALLGIHA